MVFKVSVIYILKEKKRIDPLCRRGFEVEFIWFCNASWITFTPQSRDIQITNSKFFFSLCPVPIGEIAMYWRSNNTYKMILNTCNFSLCIMYVYKKILFKLNFLFFSLVLGCILKLWMHLNLWLSLINWKLIIFFLFENNQILQQNAK